jgi:hypothetical protein
MSRQDAGRRTGGRAEAEGAAAERDAAAAYLDLWERQVSWLAAAGPPTARDRPGADAARG